MPWKWFSTQNSRTDSINVNETFFRSARPTSAHDRILGASTLRKVSRCNMSGQFLMAPIFFLYITRWTALVSWQNVVPHPSTTVTSGDWSDSKTDVIVDSELWLPANLRSTLHSRRPRHICHCSRDSAEWNDVYRFVRRPVSLRPLVTLAQQASRAFPQFLFVGKPSRARRR